MKSQLFTELCFRCYRTHIFLTDISNEASCFLRMRQAQIYHRSICHVAFLFTDVFSDHDKRIFVILLFSIIFGYIFLLYFFFVLYFFVLLLLSLSFPPLASNSILILTAGISLFAATKRGTFDSSKCTALEISKWWKKPYLLSENIYSKLLHCPWWIWLRISIKKKTLYHKA